MAAQLFEERGVQNATMQDLADRLGIAKPTLYVHARSKAEILEGIFERFIHQFDEGLTDARNNFAQPDQQLKAVIECWARVATSYHAHNKLFFGAYRELPPRVARHFTRWQADLFEALRDIVRDGQRRGVFDASLDPSTACCAIVGATNWTARWFSPDGLSIEQVGEQLAQILLQGLTNPGRT